NDAAERILDHRLVPGPAREGTVALELDAGQASVVDARVADHLCPYRPERVEAPLLGIEAETREALLLQRRRLGRIRLPRHVDEPLRTVGELRVERVRVDSE